MRDLIVTSTFRPVERRRRSVQEQVEQEQQHQYPQQQQTLSFESGRVTTTTKPEIFPVVNRGRSGDFVAGTSEWRIPEKWRR